MRGKGQVLVAVTLALALVPAAACGGGGGGKGDLAAFCKLMSDLDAQGSEPSDEQLDKVVDAAPEEVRDDVKTLAETAKKVGNDPEAAAKAFEDQDLVKAATNVQKFQTDKCREATTTSAAGATPTTTP